MSSNTKKISALQLVTDIRTGLTDGQIMEKHGLSAKQLEFLFHKLIEGKFVTRRQLEERMSLAETAVTKAFVDVEKSIQELDSANDPEADRMYKELLGDLAEESAPSAPWPPKQGTRRTIKGSDLVRDITSGMTDPELLLKYQIAPGQLEFMLGKLVSAGRITKNQLLQRTKITSTSITKAFVDVYDSLRELDDDDWS